MSKINLRNSAFLGIGLMILGFVFGLAETLYFGGNWMPSCKEELFCDIIASQICGAGMGIYCLCVYLRVKTHLSEIKKLRQSN
jgi:hypothetical protein